jgi:hypothetical protein
MRKLFLFLCDEKEREKRVLYVALFVFEKDGKERERGLARGQRRRSILWSSICKKYKETPRHTTHV